MSLIIVSVLWDCDGAEKEMVCIRCLKQPLPQWALSSSVSYGGLMAGTGKELRNVTRRLWVDVFPVFWLRKKLRRVVGDQSFKSAQFCLISKGKHELFTRILGRNLTFLCGMTSVLSVGPNLSWVNIHLFISSRNSPCSLTLLIYPKSWAELFQDSHDSCIPEIPSLPLVGWLEGERNKAGREVWGEYERE